jgi:hypothetical protein
VKKRMLAMLSAMGFALMALLGLASAAQADPGNGAVVIKDGVCGLFDGNGAVVLSDSSHSVVTPSDNGMIKCQADVTPAAAGGTVKYNFANTGVLCGGPLGVTEDWQEVVSASGKATLTCKFHS